MLVIHTHHAHGLYQRLAIGYDFGWWPMHQESALKHGDIGEPD